MYTYAAPKPNVRSTVCRVPIAITNVNYIKLVGALLKFVIVIDATVI